jgi:hypothetical protein
MAANKSVKVEALRGGHVGNAQPSTKSIASRDEVAFTVAFTVGMLRRALEGIDDDSGLMVVYEGDLCPATSVEVRTKVAPSTSAESDATVVVID